ncbi:MAG: apolipoprotein N-acyltransferase [Spirochaetaceae bacterium]|nr:apolipoprotein N-acyltransferase [Spirochaetaceae bacterium]
MVERCQKTDSHSLLARCGIALSLLVISIILFALPQPNLLTVQGIPFLAYFALVPVFLLVRFVSWKTVWLFGIAYGVGAYCLFTYWLATFHPLGIFVISFMYGLYLMVAFPLLKAAASLFPKWGWLVQGVVWCAYDFVKTLGFSGFHYGVLSYSHWRWTPLIQIVDVVGVWGLDALITFTSAWFTAVIIDAYRNRAVECCGCRLKALVRALPAACRAHWISGCCWLVVFVGVLVYGFVSPVDYSQEPQVEVALIQQNSDPWVGGMTAYQRDLKTLMRLSDQALAQNPQVDFVVWPETAFVPRIAWHYRHRYERDKFQLVQELLQYLDRAPVPFVIGNDHGVDGVGNRILDYNAVLLFKPGENTLPPTPDIYSKMKLVPFTEYFPFDKQFPQLYQMLLNGDTHMWEPGVEPVVFEVDGLRFSTPICFEDTFGFVGRRFVNAGAQAFVNLSNDAWSKSLACQYQHLSMAVFRSVENRVPTVRSTTTGQTCIIDPNGRILAMAEPFVETYLVGSIPVLDKTEKTVYTRLGDYVGVIFAMAAILLLLAGLLARMLRKVRT